MFEIDSESGSSGECHLPKKQGSEVRRSRDVVMQSPRSHNGEYISEKILNANSAAALREEGRESNMAEADQCMQSANISCSLNSKNNC